MSNASLVQVCRQIEDFFAQLRELMLARTNMICGSQAQFSELTALQTPLKGTPNKENADARAFGCSVPTFDRHRHRP